MKKYNFVEYKVKRISKLVTLEKEKRQWQVYWDMYFKGLVTIENLKGLMTEKYENLRPITKHYGN